MFDNLIKRIQALSTISVPIAADELGYIDRECPEQACMFQFKVLEQDWSERMDAQKQYCPSCGKVAPGGHWFTQRQLDQGKQKALEILDQEVDQGLAEDSYAFNERQESNSFIRMTMNYQPAGFYEAIGPITATEAMTQRITCSQCQCRYAVVGAAFFCPCCGHNSAEETFDQSMTRILAALEFSHRTGEITGIDQDIAAIIAQGMVADALVNIVVAYQRFCDVVFARMAPSVSVPFNAFQNLDKGSELWQNNFGAGYHDWLTGEQYQVLLRNFQQRHLLSHKEGFVDQRYIDHTTDTTYQVGQRLVVKSEQVAEFAAVVQRLTSQIKGLPAYGQ